MLTGKMYQYQWGSRRELVETWHYLIALYGREAFTGEVYGRKSMFGVREDTTIQEGAWLFAFRPTSISNE